MSVVLVGGQKAWPGLVAGREMFSRKQCAVPACSISFSNNALDKADLVVSKAPATERPNIRCLFIEEAQVSDIACYIMRFTIFCNSLAVLLPHAAGLTSCG